jgi:ArsR family transcriptional regulator
MDEFIIEKSVSMLKTLGDQTRFKILHEIMDKSVSVNDIAESLGMSQSAISHQLKVLKTANLVKNERRGKEVYYSLTDTHVKSMIEEVYNHASHKNYE